MGRAVETLGRVGTPLTTAEMARRRWNAVMVGGGHNGLTAAAYLARAGRSVLVLERREVLGGACTLEEPWPGYRISPCAYLVGLLHPLVVDELELDRHGYRVTISDPQLVVPFPDGGAFIEWLDEDRTVRDLRALAPDQVDAYQAYQGLWQRMRAGLRPAGGDDVWLGDPPSRIELADRLDHDPVAVAALFDDSMVELLERFFTDRRFVDAFCGQGVIGTNASPYDPGTASVAFHHSSGRIDGRSGDWGFVTGGMGMVSFALADAAARAGAVVAAGVPVGRIRPGEGVELESGELIPAEVVVSNADPAATLALLDDPPAAFSRQVGAVPRLSPVVKVTYALAELPRFRADLPPTLGMINLTGGADALHQSYLAAQRGGVSDELWCELYFQTVYDPTIAPPGRHVLSAFCQYVPYRFAAGSWDDHREEVGDRVDATIERFAPGFGRLVLHRQVEGPPDLEQRLGLSGGHIFHGECLPDHMWDRRLPHRTPVEGLYLCGAGTHPGGSVIAANGRNAAMAVLADLDR